MVFAVILIQCLILDQEGVRLFNCEEFDLSLSLQCLVPAEWKDLEATDRVNQSGIC